MTGLVTFTLCPPNAYNAFHRYQRSRQQPDTEPPIKKRGHRARKQKVQYPVSP